MTTAQEAEAALAIGCKVSLLGRAVDNSVAAIATWLVKRGHLLDVGKARGRSVSRGPPDS